MTTKSVLKQMICVSCLWRRRFGRRRLQPLVPCFFWFCLHFYACLCLSFCLPSLVLPAPPSSSPFILLCCSCCRENIVCVLWSLLESLPSSNILFPLQDFNSGLVSGFLVFSIRASGLVSNFLSKTWLWGDGVHSVRHTRRREDGGGAETADNNSR